MTSPQPPRANWVERVKAHLTPFGRHPDRQSLSSAVRRALAADRAEEQAHRRLLCEPLEPRYLLSADILPLSPGHADSLDLTVDYDATVEVMRLIDNEVQDEGGAGILLATIDAPGDDVALTITHDPSYGDNGALIIGTEQSPDGRRVEIITGDGDDRVQLVNLDFDGLRFSVDTGEGRDVLVLGTLGPTDGLSHEHTGPQHGRVGVEGSAITHEYAGVELLELGADSDTQTLTPTRGANVTLAQTTDGQLITMVQHAFDATTGLDQFDGSDGFRMEAVGGGFGQAVSPAGDVNNDGFEDIIVGAPGADAAYLIYGTDQGFDATLDPAALDGSNGLLLMGPAGQNFGFAVGGGGDVNGDGIDDVIVGAPGPLGSFTAGNSYVVFGTDGGGAASLDVASLDGSDGFVLTGAQAGEASGYSVAVAGDVNGDGLADLVIGAPESDTAGIDAGAVYLVFGSDRGFEASTSLAALNGRNGFALTGGAAGDAAGTAVAAGGDLNGDYVADVVIGAPGADPNGQDSGAAYAFFGAVDFDVANGLAGLFFDTGPVTSLAAARDAIDGTLPTATFLAYAIDYPNGDGADTVSASTAFEDFVGVNVEDIDGGAGATVDGSVFLFDGYLHVPEAGTYTFEVGSAEGFSLAIDGETVIEHDGTRAFDQSTGSHTFAEPGFYAISLLYFTDSDPSGIELKSDLVTSDGSLALIPREFLYTNPPKTAWDLSALDGFTGFVLEGEAAGDGLGSAVGTAGDVNVDTAADLIVGAPGHDGAGADSGRAYVVFGKTLTTVFESFAATLQAGSLADGSGLILDGTAAGARTGSAVGGGDLNADGDSDAIVGSPGSGVGGVIQVLFGEAGLGVDEGLDEAIGLAQLDGVVGFTASTEQVGAGLGNALAVADLNGDGDVDLLAGESASGGASVLFGRSVGGQTTTTTYELPASAFIIDGDEAGARITLGVPASPEPLLGGDDREISEDIDMAGADFAAHGRTLVIEPGVTVSTRDIAAGEDPGTAESIGNSGNVALHFHLSVEIGTGAAIYAHVEEGSGFEPGDVQITVKNQVPFIPAGGAVQAFTQEGRYHATVSIGDGVAIRGGNVTIEADAGSYSFFANMGTAAAGISNSLVGAVRDKYGDLLKLVPVSVILSSVTARIEVGASDSGDGVSIEAADDVRIEANAAASAKGNAIQWGQLPDINVGGFPFAFAIAFWSAESTSTVTLHSNVEVSSAEGDIDIGAEANTAAGGKAKVAQNIDQGNGRAAGHPANPNNIGLAVGMAVTSTTARVEVPEGARVSAEAGSVSITASGEDKVVTRAQTTSYEQGAAGIAFSVIDTSSDIRALVNGEVHAGVGDSQDDRDAEFNPFLAVDSVNDTIDLGQDHGYETGDRVHYSVGFGWAIDGLERGGSYFVIADESHPGLIRLAATRDDALAGTAIDFGANPELTTTEGERIAFTQADDVLDLIDFGFDPGFDEGDAVVYRAATEKPVYGLTDGNTYYVVPVAGNAQRWQLASDAAGTDLVDFDLSPYFLTSAGERITIDSVDEDSDLVNFAEAAEIQTGDALTFHSALGFRLLDGEENLIGDGTVLYAVVPPLADDDPQDGVTSIRLARTQEDAEGIRGGMVTPYPVTLSLEVDIDLMLGAAHLLAPFTGDGITIKADLESEFTLQSKVGLGSGPANVFKRYTEPEFSWAAAKYRMMLYEKLGDPRAAPAQNGSNPIDAKTDLAGAASLGVHRGIATVEAVVGGNAVLESAGDIEVTAEHEQVGDSVIESGATQTEEQHVGLDIGVAFSLSLFSNDVYAVVNRGASLDAGREIKVEANYERRFAAPITSGEDFGEFLLNEFSSAPATFINELNTSLLHPLFTTGWTFSNVSPKKTDVAVAGALQLAFYDNTVEAIVAGGAKLNQKAEFATDEQAVTVSADTTAYLVDAVGVFEFNFTPENIFKRAFRFANGKPFIELTEGESGAFGASFHWLDVTNRTVAALGVASPLNNQGDTVNPVASATPARVHISSEEKLTVQSSETLWAFGFGNSGAKTEGGNISFAGTGMVFRHNPGNSGETRAQIGTGTVVTGGSVEVSADDELIVVYENGAIITGDNATGIGVGVNYLEINRRLRAFIGDLDGEATGKASFLLDDTSTIDVSATSNGVVVSFALAYANRATEEDQPHDSGNDVDEPQAQDDDAGASEHQQAVGDGAHPGKSGFQLAGDASVIDLVTDQVLAFIDDPGTFQAGRISVEAGNVNDYLSFVGAFAVSDADYDSSSNVGLAGSFAGLKLHSGSSDGMGRHDSDTLAYVRRATLAVGAAGLAVSADRRGVYFGAAAGGAGVSRGSGIEVAGSVTWTDLDYRTRAYLDSASVTLAGDSSIEARDRVATIGFAGDGVFKSSIGFGTAWAWNQVDRQVQATALGSTITQSAGTLSLDAVIWDIAPSENGTLLPSAYAVAVTLGLGDPNQTALELTGTVAVNHFNTDTDDAAVDASLHNSSYQVPDDPTAVTGLALSATDNTNLVALAGAVDGDAAVNIGVAAAVNELGGGASAVIEKSDVTVNKGDVTLEAVVNPELNALAVGLAISNKDGAVLAGSGARNTARGLGADARISGDATDPSATPIAGAANIDVHAEVRVTDVAAAAGEFGLQPHSGAGAAIGAAVAINDFSDTSITAGVADAVLTASRDIDVSARTGMAPDGVILGLAVGGEGASNFALGGSVVDTTVKPTTQASVSGAGTRLTAGRNVSVTADEDELVISSGAGVISATTREGGKAAIGAAVATNTVDSRVTASVETGARSDDEPSIQSTGGAVTVSAGREDAVIVAVALGGEAARDFALGGSVATNTVSHITDAHVSGGTQVSGAGDVAVTATESAPVIVAAAGNFTASNEGIAIGAAVPTNTVTRHLTAYVGDSDRDDYKAGADGAGLTATTGTATVQATRRNSLLLAIGVSGEGAEKFALGGSVVENNVTESTVDAHVWGGGLDGGGGVEIEAQDTEATSVAIAGNVDLSFGFRAGGGSGGSSSVSPNQFVDNASGNAASDNAGSGQIDDQQAKVQKESEKQVKFSQQEIDNYENDRAFHEKYQNVVRSDGSEVDAVDEPAAEPPAPALAAGDGISVGIALANNLNASPMVVAFASDSTLSSDGGSIEIEASQSALFVTVAGSGSLSDGTVDIDATEATTDYRPVTRAYIDAIGTESPEVTADGNVIVAADSVVHGVTIAGNVAFNKSGTSVAGTVATMAHREASTEAWIDHADVTASGNDDGGSVAIGHQGNKSTDDDFHGVSVTATSKQVFTTVAAGIELSGKSNIAASVTLNLIGDQASGSEQLVTRAYVGAGATLNEDNADAGAAQSVNVFANSDTTVHGGGGALGISTGNSWGGGAGADGGKLAKLTEAYIAAPTVNANNLVLVEAYSRETLASYEGSIQISDGSVLAGALGVYVLDLGTHAYIASGSQVTSSGSVLVAAHNETRTTFFTGTVEASGGDVTVGASVAVSVLTAHTDAYIDDDAEVTGLAAEGTDTISAATGQYLITYTDDVADDGTELAPPGGVPSATAGDGKLSADDPVWTRVREATAEYSDIRGVAVTANASEQNKGFVGTGGGSKELAVQGAFYVPATTRTTTARVSGTVNATDDLASASAAQDAVVSAGSDYHALAVTGVLAGSEGGVAAPAVSWHWVDLATHASVDEDATVAAGGDVLVSAAASEHLTRVVVGVGAASGAFSLEASVSGVNLTSSSEAWIGADAVVSAVGNVVVSATDDTTTTSVAGGAALAVDELSGALGAGFIYTDIHKTTEARIDENAIVDAGAQSDPVPALDGEIDDAENFTTTTLSGVVVQARSTESVTSFALAGGAAAIVGVGGGVTYTFVHSDTHATIADGAQVNQSGGFSAAGAQSVNVSAGNAVEVLDVGGGFAAAIGAAAGGISVGMVRNTTTASIASGANVSARRDIDVHAAAIKDVKSYAVSVAAGLGVAGSVSVWALGDKFSPHYDTANSSGNDSLAIQNGGSGEGSPYGSVYQSNGDQPSYIDGQANRADAVSGMSGYANPDDDPNQAKLLALRDQGSAAVQSNSDAQAGAASSALGATDPLDTVGQTEAVVAGAVIAGGDHAITSREFTRVTQVAGAGEFGGSVGASVAIAAVRGAALAHLDGSATAGGELVVRAERRGDYHSDAIIGQAGVAGAGAGVAIVVDKSEQAAYIDDGAKVLGASRITVSAERSNIAFKTFVVEAQLEFAGAVGASVAQSKAEGRTTAYIGDAAIGDPDAANATVGAVSIEAVSDLRPEAKAYAGSGGLALAGDGTRADALVTPTVEAFFDSRGGPAAANADPAAINRIGGDLSIVADSTAEPTAVTLGIAVSIGIAVPVSLPTAVASPTVRSYLRGIARVVGSAQPNSGEGKLEILAIATDDPYADGLAAGGAVGLVVGVTSAQAKNETVLEAYIDGYSDIDTDGNVIQQNSTVTTNTDLIIQAEHDYVGYARGRGDDYGVDAVTVNDAILTIQPTVSAYIGEATVTTGGDVEIVAESGEPGSLPELSFDTGTSIDYATNIITFDRPHGLSTGDTVIYHADNGSPIGLEDGVSYDVIRISGTQIKLGALFTADDVDSATGSIRFQRPHSLTSGSPVIYDSNGNPSVNGVVPGVVYFVNAFSPGVAKIAETAAIADNLHFDVFDGQDDVDLEADEIRLPVAYLRTGDDLSLTGELSSDRLYLPTHQASTNLEVGDAVLYVAPGSADEGLIIAPLVSPRAYFVSDVLAGSGNVRVALAETRAGALAGEKIEFEAVSNGGRLIGVDASSWMLTGAGVNSPSAFVAGTHITATGISSSEEGTPFPFETGDLVVWTRGDGNYGTGERFGLLPGVAYYASLSSGGAFIRFAETLEDLESQRFVGLHLDLVNSSVNDYDSFLSPLFPVQSGDAFTYHAPPPIQVAGEDLINGTLGTTPFSLLVRTGDRLYTTVQDLTSLPAVPGQQRGLLGSWYSGGTVSNLQDALFHLASFPDGVWVSEGVDYPNNMGSNATTAPSGTTIAGLIGTDSDSLIGRAATPTIPHLVLNFEGFVQVHKAGTYEFEVRSDDGFELKIDDFLVTSFSGTRGYAASKGNFTFQKPGFYPIQLVYFNSGGSGGVQLRSNLMGRDGMGNNLILDEEVLFLPQGVVYDGPATRDSADIIAPLGLGGNYAVVTDPLFPLVGIQMPLSHARLDPGAGAGATMHQFRVPGFDPIDGLEDGNTYYMIVDETRPGVVRLATSRDAARDGIAIDLGPAPAVQVPVDEHRTADTLGDDGIRLHGVGGAWQVSAAGDFNGDYLRDQLVATVNGAKYLVFGTTANDVDVTDLDPTRGVRIDLPGDVIAGVGDVNADGLEDIAIGNPAANEVQIVLGSAAGFPATLSTADFVISGADPGDQLGAAVAGADVNGDGIDDLILGAPGTNRSFVVYGAAGLGVTGQVDLGVLEGAGNGLQGAYYDTNVFPTLHEAELAAALTTPDLLFTSTALDYPAAADIIKDSAGLAALLGGDAPAGTPDTDLDGSVFTYAGYLHVPRAGTYTFEVHADDGFRLRIGGQVVAEKSISGPFASLPGIAHVSFDRAGLVPIELVHWEVEGSTGVRLESDIGGSMGVIPTELLSTIGGYVIEGAPAGAGFGSTVADGGDINGDGVEDLLIAAPLANSGAGDVYVLFGASHARGTSLDLSTLHPRQGTVLHGTSGSAAGTSLSGPGDLNGDGYGDVLVGAPLGNAADKAYVVFGAERFDDAVELGALDGAAGFGINGGGATQIVSATGDLNSDGFADFAVGRPQTATGTVLVVYGSPTLGRDGNGLVSFTVDGGGGVGFGGSLAAPGDVNGDGVSDLLVGAVGSAHVILGAPSRFAFEAIDANGDTVRLPSTANLSTGDALYYTGAEGVHVGGLERNTEYFVIATATAGTIQLAVSPDDAMAGRAIDLDLSPRVEIEGLGTFRVRPSTQQIDSLVFDSMPAIESGQALVYHAAWGTRLVGLEDGATYYAIVSAANPHNTVRLSLAEVGAANSDGFTHSIAFHVGAEQVRGTHYLGVEGLGITRPGNDLGPGANIDVDDLDGIDGMRLDGPAGNAAAGTAVTGLGDVDGDGVGDALIVATDMSYLVLGFDDPDVASLALGTEGVPVNLSGTATGLIGDINGDGLADIVIGDASHSGDTGQVSIVFGSSDGFDGSIDAADLTLTGLVPGDLFGQAVAGADVNADGFVDLIVGAPGVDGAGAVYVLFGGESLGPMWHDAVQASAPLDWYRFNGNDSAVVDSGSAGLDGTLENGAMRLPGPVDGAIAFDGIDDFIALNGSPLRAAWTAEFVVQRRDGSPGTLLAAAANPGNVFLKLIQPGNPEVGYSTLDVADYRFSPSYVAPLGEFVHLTFVNDPDSGVSLYVNGELAGSNSTPIPLARLQITSAIVDPADMVLDEVVIFDRALDASEIAVHAAAFVNVDKRIVIEAPDGTDAMLGWAVANAGDVNGDLVEDVIVGAPGIDTAYVFFGSAGGFVPSLSVEQFTGRTGVTLHGAADSQAGQRVSGAGDVDGDGFEDILIGAPLADPDGLVDAGQTYLVFGQGRAFPADVDLTALDGTDGVILNGGAAGDHSGQALSGAGDVNGDDLGDFVIGAPLADAEAAADSGRAYVVFGSGDLRGTAAIGLSDLGERGAVLHGGSAGDGLGGAVAAAGDFNGDGIADLLLGAPGVTVDGQADAGRAYVVYGIDPNAAHFLIQDLTAPAKPGSQRLEQSNGLQPTGLTGTPTVTTWASNGNTVGGLGTTSTAHINPSVRAFVGATTAFGDASEASVNALGGDVFIQAFSATDVHATSTGWLIEAGPYAIGGGAAESTLNLTPAATQAYLSAGVVVDAGDSGRFSLLAVAHDTLRAWSTANSGGALAFFHAHSDVTAQRVVEALVGAAASVTAGDIELSANKSTNARAEATANAGGFVVVPSSRATLDVGQAGTPTMLVRTLAGSSLTAANTVTLNVGTSDKDSLVAKASSQSYAGVTGQNTRSDLELNERATANVNAAGTVTANELVSNVALDWSMIYLDANGKTRSLFGAPTVQANLTGTVQGNSNLAGDIPANTSENVDVADGHNIADVHTLASWSVFWARIPASHPNENNSLNVIPDPGASEPPNALPEVLTLEPSSLSAGDLEIGDKVRVVGTFHDEDIEDVHTATIDWGDGTVESLVVEQEPRGGIFHGGHRYTAGGIYEVVVTVTDDAGDSVSETLILHVSGARLSDGELQIVGTAENDEVEIVRRGRELVVSSENLGELRYDLNTVDSIVVRLGDGDDRLNVSQNVEVPLTIYGGAGDDFLSGGRGDDLLVGGPGDDELRGGGGTNRAGYFGTSSDYLIQRQSNVRAVVADLGGSDPDEGTDQLMSIAVAEFVDREVELRGRRAFWFDEDDGGLKPMSATAGRRDAVVDDETGWLYFGFGEAELRP